MIANIQSLLIDGTLFEFHNLTTMKHVELACGSSFDLGTYENESRVMRYRNTEFSFYKNYLVLIAIYNREINKSFDKEFPDWLENTQLLRLPKLEFLDYLDKSNISWEVNELHSNKWTDAISLKSGLVVYFDIEQEAAPVYSMMRSFPPPKE